MRHVMNTRKSRLVAGGISAGVLAIVGTGAFAFYSDAQATADAKAGTASPITILTVDAPQSLVPGGQAKPINVNVQNQTGDPQTVGQVTVVIDPVWYKKGNSNLPQCDASDYVIAQAPSAGELQPNAQYTVSPTIRMKNKPTNQDNCKGEKIPLLVTLGTPTEA